jgi:hypothetical protein
MNSNLLYSSYYTMLANYGPTTTPIPPYALKKAPYFLLSLRYHSLPSSTPVHSLADLILVLFLATRGLGKFMT